MIYVYNERRKMGAQGVLFLMCVPLATSEIITTVTNPQALDCSAFVSELHNISRDLWSTSKSMPGSVQKFHLGPNLAQWNQRSHHIHSFYFLLHYPLHITAVPSPTPATVSYLDSLHVLLSPSTSCTPYAMIFSNLKCDHVSYLLKHFKYFPLLGVRIKTKIPSKAFE